MSAAVEAWLADNKPRLLAELLGFIAQPSVSTDPAYAAGMAGASAILEARLRRIGMHNVQRLNAGGHDAIYASWLDAPGQPTILVYGHYDVQPPDPLALWETPPFEPTIRDGKIFARGASDDKSPLWIAISGLEAWLAVTGALPINVKLLLEGEEEIGSRSLPHIMATHRDLLTADVLVSADGGRWRPGIPTINTNSRGITAMELTLRTAGTDLHSGRYGGPVGNAATALARLLATLHDTDGRIAVPGFMDGLKRPSNAVYAGMHGLGFDEPGFFAEIGARPGAIEPGVELLESLWLRPTIEVNGLWGGYQGPGGKTVIPALAHAKLSCRLGPGQNPIRAADALEAHLRAHLPAWADLDITRERGGTAAYAVPDEDPYLLAVERVIASVHGQKPLRVGVGGTLPISAMAKETLGLETVMLSYAIADERIHAPNEFFRLSSFDDGLLAWARLPAELSR